MRITILAIGSEGDVRPILALGKGLQAAHYDVCVATHAVFEKLVCDLRLGFALIQANPKEALEGEAGQNALEKGVYRDFVRILHPLIFNAAVDSLEACQGTDAVIFTSVGWYIAPHICEKLNVPGIGVYYPPVGPTRTFASYIVTRRDLGGTLNRMTYLLADAYFWLPYRRVINKFRHERLNLPPRGLNWQNEYQRQRNLSLFPYSPHILPKPKDWDDRAIVTGYWFLEDLVDWKPPARLSEFLAAGSPPVYIGFGSMSSRKPEETANIALQALASSKQRGVLATGWGGLSKSDLPDDVFTIERAPHSWLFPKMAAIVHHGGAGTTGAALRAGIPSIVVPHFMDQPFWGHRVVTLGAGPQPIPRSQLTAEHLAYAIALAVNDQAIRQRASMLGEQIRAENGVARAVEAIDKYLSH